MIFLYKSLSFTMYKTPALITYISFCRKSLTINDFRQPGCHNSLVINNL